MCGIFGYIGQGDAGQNILNGLKRLEYRGYDSWGVAVVSRDRQNGDSTIEVAKKVGSIGALEELKDLPKSNIGIGHTRWATHGGVTEVNAHPHYSTDHSFVLAQNGIVENYQELKKELAQKGYSFSTETDTEIIVRNVEFRLSQINNLKEAVRKAFLDLKGRNTIIVLSSEHNQVIAVRNGSPLVVGIGDGEYFFASDTLSFADKTDEVIYIDDKQMVEYKDGDLKLFDVENNKELKIKIRKLDHEDVSIDKEGFAHFMLKEIVDQKHTIREAIQYSEEEMEPIVNIIKNSRNIYTVGAGTASFAAGQIAYFLRKYAGVNAIELKSYEMESYKELFTENDLLIAVSQSGETADTIEAVELAKQKGAKIGSIVNMVGSTITRLSDFPYFLRSGPEICVVSTKAFTAMCSWGLLLALSVKGEAEKARKAINNLSEELDRHLNEDFFACVKKVTEKLLHHEHIFVLGRGQNYYLSLEAGLKLKETAYKHTEGFAAGELKHGVIALIEKGTPIFVLISEDNSKSDMLSAAAEVKARGAHLIGIATKENELFDDFIKTPEGDYADSIANIIPFHLLAYYLAVELGYNPDKPRNLAKSVTVK
ncbi:glutamine--fructose-6-phosphate transaminase (isomerizing) [Candidatus Dojkabacteria bacterium]|nr:glutamine--fructose-6-phosphate transaminase (isomerizing) [Candidatus Dojkabacteria bacterium]